MLILDIRLSATVMPEGPSIVLLKEEVEQFNRHKILTVNGNSKIEQSRLVGKSVNFKSWGKHFLICFKDFTVRIHFLMFGSYSVNEKKQRPARLSLTFTNGELNFYSCAIKILEGEIDTYYDWSDDVMNDAWDPEKAFENLNAIPENMICDALLEQDIFAGAGNIIKNEVLYRVHVHPESIVGKIPPPTIKMLVDECRNYSFEFLNWKRNYELRAHWLAHTKKTCLRCNLPFVKKNTGVKERRSFFCLNCQQLYV